MARQKWCHKCFRQRLPRFFREVASQATGLARLCIGCEDGVPPPEGMADRRAAYVRMNRCTPPPKAEPPRVPPTVPADSLEHLSDRDVARLYERLLAMPGVVPGFCDARDEMEIRVQESGAFRAGGWVYSWDSAKGTLRRRPAAPAPKDGAPPRRFEVPAIRTPADWEARGGNDLGIADERSQLVLVR